MSRNNRKHKVAAIECSPRQKPVYGEILNAFNPVQPLQYTGDYNRQQSWEEINALYTMFATGLVETGQYLSVLVNYIKNGTTDKQEEILVIERGISRDLISFSSELLAINNMHKGRSGVISSPDDLAFCLDIFNQYTVFKDRMTVTLHNYALELTTMSSELRAELQPVIIDTKPEENKEENV